MIILCIMSTVLMIILVVIQGENRKTNTRLNKNYRGIRVHIRILVKIILTLL